MRIKCNCTLCVFILYKINIWVLWSFWLISMASMYTPYTNIPLNWVHWVAQRWSVWWREGWIWKPHLHLQSLLDHTKNQVNGATNIYMNTSFTVSKNNNNNNKRKSIIVDYYFFFRPTTATVVAAIATIAVASAAIRFIQKTILPPTKSTFLLFNKI